MRNTLKAAVIAATMAGATLTVAAPAEAHIATFTADCLGVTVAAVRYDAGHGVDLNHWTVTIGGVTQTGSFGSSFINTFPVPQGGATTDWSASIDAPGTRFDFSDSGTVGPCGDIITPPSPTPPTPTPPSTKHARTTVTIVDKCNCYRDKVTMHSGRHLKVKIRTQHPSNTLWVFTVTGLQIGNVTYLLPDKIGGHSGWAQRQVYRVHTKNQPCPCTIRGDCHALYPHFTPPPDHCKGRAC